MAKLSFHKPYMIFILAFSGAIIGALVMYFDAYSTAESTHFANTSSYRVWASINIFAFALYPTLGIVLWNIMATYKEYFRKEIYISSAILFILFAMPDSLAFFYPRNVVIPLTHYIARFALILVFGMICIGLPAAITIWLIGIGLRQEFNGDQFNDKQFEKYNLFREDLKLIISFLGVIVGLLALAAAAFRQTSIAAGIITPMDDPIIYVLLYGTYFTLLLVLIYVPIHWLLLTTGHRICNLTFQLPNPSASTWADMYEKRKNLQGALQISSTDPQSWQSALAVLAPLVSGIISILLEKR